MEERERGSDALFRLAKLCESAAAVSRPTTADDLKNNPQAPQNPDGDWHRFFDFVRLAGWCYKAGAEFREPKMLGVAIAPTPPSIDEREEPEIIRLRVFEGDRQVKLIERKPRDVA